MYAERRTARICIGVESDDGAHMNLLLVLGHSKTVLYYRPCGNTCI